MTLENILKRLDKIEKDILKLKSDVALEQVKNNEVLKEYLNELDTYSVDVLDILKEKYESIIPKNENSNVNTFFLQSENLRSILKMIGNEEMFVERFGLDKTINDIGNGKNVDRINEALKSFILNMNSIGINLTVSDFDYSVYTTKYMRFFMDNINKDNYLFVMKKCFDSIYWECPLLLTHLELSVRSIIEKNKKTIIKQIDKKMYSKLKQVNLSKDDVFDKYIETKQKFTELKMKDFYNVFEYFKKNSNEIDKHIEGTSSFDLVIAKFINKDKYYTMNKEDKKFFYSNIKSLYYDLIEYKMISKFSNIYKYLAKLLDSKEDYTSKYKESLKNIKGYEKSKNNLNRKIIFLINKRNHIKDSNKEKINKINDQIKDMSVLMSKSVEDIKSELDIITNMRFINNLKKDINQTSTIYEVSHFISKYYQELYKIFLIDKNIGEEEVLSYVDEFRHIQYNPYLTIMNSMSFLDIDNVKDLIIKKYGMYDINIAIPDDYHELDKVFDDLMVLIRLANINSTSYTAENISILLKINEEIDKSVKILEDNF